MLFCLLTPLVWSMIILQHSSYSFQSLIPNRNAMMSMLSSPSSNSILPKTKIALADNQKQPRRRSSTTTSSGTKSNRNNPKEVVPTLSDKDIDFFRELINEHDRKYLARNIGTDIDDNQLQQTKVLNSVIRVHCTHSSPNFAMPWQRNKQDYSSSTGFIISIPSSNNARKTKTKKYILTNAHAVEYGSLIQVKKRQSENKYIASVIAVGHECDLAILNVEDVEFWQDLESLEFGNLPDLFEDVSVIGYPIGGDSVSITSGVVSRIEMQEYVQASAQLLAIQIDAAINPGNSGGPVFNRNNKVIGVAFQSLSSEETENIGYVIPVPVVYRFIDDYIRNNKFSGICALGVRFQGMESNTLRQFHGMSDSETGVMVAEVMPLGASNGKLLKNDIMMGIYQDTSLVTNREDISDKMPVISNKKNKVINKNIAHNHNEENLIQVANDGSIPFRESSNKMYKERVHLSFFFSQKFPNDFVKLYILRNNTRINVTIQLSVPIYLVHNTLVKNNYIDTKLNIGTGTNGSIVGGVPSYLVIGGLVFVVLSQEYLKAEFDITQMGDAMLWGEEFRLFSLTNAPITEQNEEVVLLSQVIAHSCNIGYERAHNLQLTMLNNQNIKNLKHLKMILYSCQDENLVFEFKNGQQMVLNRAAAMNSQNQICKEHFIPSPHSRDLE